MKGKLPTEKRVDKKRKPKLLRENVDYGDWCVYEIFSNPVHFTQFIFPDPSDHDVHLDTYLWDTKHALNVWPFQYPFLLWAVGVICCGKNIGKSLLGIVLRRIWKSMWGRNSISVIASPKGQHSERLFNFILRYFTSHHLLNYWRTVDHRRAGEQSRKYMWFKTKSLWTCQALIPGNKGEGFQGERGNDRTIDEAQDMTDIEHKQLRNLLEEPFLVDRGSEDLSFGVPNGNRTTPFYRMDTDDVVYPQYTHFRRKIPCFLPPNIMRSRFIALLRENQCRYKECGDRVVVKEWSNEAKQLMLGQWGEPTIPCYPTVLYTKNIHDDLLLTYQIVRVTRGMVEADMGDLRQNLYKSGNRYTIEGLNEKGSQVIVSVDPGKNNCVAQVWGRRKVGKEPNFRWWLLMRMSIVGVQDGPTQAKVVDAIASHWGADIIVCDSTAQSAYLSDLLGDTSIFPGRKRYYLRDSQTRLIELVREARDHMKQGDLLIIGINFTSNAAIPMSINKEEVELDSADYRSVYGLQDMMDPIQQLALPGPNVDPDFFNEVTSYSERPKGASGRRFMPDHPHLVSAFKVFWCGHWLMNILSAGYISEEGHRFDRSVGSFFGS